MVSPKGTCLVFTVFAEEGETLLDLDPSVWPHCKFATWQRELCPDTNREHFQGYLELTKEMRFSALHEWGGLETAHFEKRRGNQQAAIDYANKEETRIEGPWSYGERNRQGKRNDLDDVRDMIRTGASMREIADAHFGDFVRYERGFRSYKRLCAQKRNWTMQIIVYVGPTGCGKSRTARMNYPDAYWKPKGRWWDNYDGEETVIVDEMYGHCFGFTELLQLLDPNPYAVECKFGTIEFTSRRIVFTSNQEPEFWYNNEKTHVMSWAESPLNRRLREFGNIYRFGLVHAPPPPAAVAPTMVVAQDPFADLPELVRLDTDFENPAGF